MRTRGLVALLATLTALVGTAPAAGASSNCDDPRGQPFLPWVDPALYYLMPGGSLESSAGWTFRDGAKRVSGNEPYFVNSASDSSSLYLGPGASAISPWTCVGLTEPTVRFFAVNSGSLLSELLVTPQYRDKSGRVRSLAPLPVSALTQSVWFPTLPLPIAIHTVADDVLTVDVERTEVRFVFTSTGGLLTSGKWRIDDVYVDPIVLNW